MNHSEHYPTFIEHPDDPDKRALVKSPWGHHRQLLAWKLDGLDPVPDPPAEQIERENAGPDDPEYPKWIEHPKTGQRVLVPNKAAERDQLEAWIARKAQSTRKAESAPPAKPAASVTPVKPAAKTSMAKSGKTAVEPPTLDELLAKGYQPGLAQRMVDEEIRKFNAGLAPYGPHTEA